MRQFASTPTRALADERLTPAAKLVLTGLGCFTDERGWCYPSQKTICAITGLSERAVRDGLKALQAAEWIVPGEEASNGGTHVNTGFYVRYDAKVGEGPAKSAGGGETERQNLPVAPANPAAALHLGTIQLNDAVEIGGGDSLADPMLRTAMDPYLRAARFPGAVEGVVRGLLQGIDGKAHTVGTITRALTEMQAANVSPFSAKALGAFCERIGRDVADQKAKVHGNLSLVEGQRHKAAPVPKVPPRGPSEPLTVDWRAAAAQAATEAGLPAPVIPEASSREPEAPRPKVERDTRTPEEKRAAIKAAAREVAR